MKELYPLLFEPVFKDYIWGGRNLEKFGRKLPNSGIVAESWEISSHEDGMTKVRNGFYGGLTLQEVLEILKEDLVGTSNRWALELGKFPLLIKLLDANQPLSVQVHPGDDYAFKHEGNELGKTEMWVVLEANPDAAIIYGLSKPADAETLRQAIPTGNFEPYLNKISIKAGDHICVSAGTLHTILGGAVLAEIQQNSNTTYRVYDWSRLGADGKTRPLHIDKALDVINYDQVGCALSQPTLIESCDSFSCEKLCGNRYFITNRYQFYDDWQLSGNCNGGSLEIWGVIAGHAQIAGYELDAVNFILLPAGLGKYQIQAQQDACLLHVFTEE
jgi:mannose-6-phosphate isomerase